MYFIKRENIKTLEIENNTVKSIELKDNQDFLKLNINKFEIDRNGIYIEFVSKCLGSMNIDYLAKNDLIFIKKKDSYFEVFGSKENCLTITNTIVQHGEIEQDILFNWKNNKQQISILPNNIFINLELN